jgi:hypothetical protein
MKIVIISDVHGNYDGGREHARRVTFTQKDLNERIPRVRSILVSLLRVSILLLAFIIEGALLQ